MPTAGAIPRMVIYIISIHLSAYLSAYVSVCLVLVDRWISIPPIHSFPNLPSASHFLMTTIAIILHRREMVVDMNREWNTADAQATLRKVQVWTDTRFSVERLEYQSRQTLLKESFGEFLTSPLLVGGGSNSDR